MLCRTEDRVGPSLPPRAYSSSSRFCRAFPSPVRNSSLSLRPRTCTDAGHREHLVIADTNLLPGHPDIRPVAGGSSLPTARGLGLREHVRGVVPLPGPDRSLVLPVCSPHGSYLQRHSSPQTGYVGITSSRLYRPVWITQRYGFRQDSGAVALRPPCKSWSYKCLPPRRKGALHQPSRLLPNTNLCLCTRLCLLPYIHHTSALHCPHAHLHYLLE